jgi:hypothetical protein
VIRVRCALEEFRLVIEAPAVAARPGDLVMWAFEGLPETWVPAVLFASEARERAALGPFAALSQSDNAVFGVVADLMEGTFGYRVGVQKGQAFQPDQEAGLLLSRQGYLTVEAGERAVIVEVSYRDGDGHPYLEVSPEMVQVGPGQEVRWVFRVPGDVQQPETWQPRIEFVGFSGEGAPASLTLGPFTALTLSPAEVRGTGSRQYPGMYSYVAVVVQRQSGHFLWVSSPDPVVDSRGEAGDAGGG